MSVVNIDVSYDVTNSADHELLFASRALREAANKINESLREISATLNTRAKYIHDEIALTEDALAPF
jgi:hypothetical protein